MRSPEATDLRRHQTITLSLLFIAGVVNFFDRASLSVANSAVRAELHLNATEMGWLLSAFSLAYGFSQLPLIGVMRRIGGRWALGGGLGLWSAAQLLTGVVRGLPSFLVFRVLLGVGESPFYPAGVQSLREWFPAESRARATALMNMSQTLALAAAPPALTWIMLAAGWRAMFELLGALGLVVAVAWCLLYRARDGEAAAVESAWRVLLRQRTVWGMMLGFGGVNYTVWLYVAWIPGYLQTARHLSIARSGWVAAVPFLFGAAGMAARGVFTDLLVRRGAVLHSFCRDVGVGVCAGDRRGEALGVAGSVAELCQLHDRVRRPGADRMAAGPDPVVHLVAGGVQRGDAAGGAELCDAGASIRSTKRRVRPVWRTFSASSCRPPALDDFG